QPAARQLSSSWAWPGSPTAAQDRVFQQFAAQGQSFFQAAGDFGAYCETCPPPLPTSNLFITIVGGTALTTGTAGGSWSSENAWLLGSGGVSPNYPIPTWQQGVPMSGNGGSTAMRNLPDVACLADEVLWVVVNNGEQGVTGGTSASAPLWAGFVALVNQQAAATGKPAVGFLNPAIYAIGKSSGYNSAFHDITTGNITNTCCGTNRFSAGFGYDLCTGWGTPNGSNLISALLAPPPALRITPATPLAFTGPFGGPFRPSAQGFTLTNDSNAPFNWMTTNTASWLSVSPAGGILTNGGQLATITATLTADATSLPLGTYAATLWFTNVNLTNPNDWFGQSRVVMLDIVAPPVITSQPTNQSVFQGATASFTVGVANSASISYQWQYNNGLNMTPIADGGDVTGSATGALIIRNAKPEEAGAYSVVVSNAAGTVSSAEAVLSILPSRPVITLQPVDQTVLVGQSATFTVLAVGNDPLLYRWQRNGSSLSDGGDISGSASSSLSLYNASLSDAGTYLVVVSNADGVAVSSGAVLTIIPITATRTTLTAMHSFTGGNDGANPAALLRAADGSFYGTAQSGGTNSVGTVFKMSAGGTVTGLYSFTGGNDGATPLAALAQGPDGNFYGTTFQGGAYDNGTVFRVTSSGVLSNLVSLNLTNGSLPYAGLTLGRNSYFYGTSYQGGAGKYGTAFKVLTNGTLTTLSSFSNGPEGGLLAARLLRGSDGNFYGTTFKGGTNGYGTVFRLAADGTLTTLASFNNLNGAFPSAELVQDANGALYGTTTSGGLFTNGAVFRLSSAGVLTRLRSFSRGSDGGNPVAALHQGSDGNFYGTT
ncbi:MAG: immunoglobulin domain-containing protein, partial [Verrucomicrobia bacterium]|nr:immunoglobulin domain-containing protein [Verrucomicrobiota bacterium]